MKSSLLAIAMEKILLSGEARGTSGRRPGGSQNGDAPPNVARTVSFSLAANYDFLPSLLGIHRIETSKPPLALSGENLEVLMVHPAGLEPATF